MIFLDCNKGPGVRLIHASVDLTVSDILSPVDVHPTVRSFFDLGEKTVNHDGHIKPLLSVQVTELLDGIFVGFTMNHSVADGTSFWHFISTLSHFMISEGKDGDTSSMISNSRQPIYKPFFPDGYGPILKLPHLEPEEFITRYEPGPLRERIFHFSSKSILILKANANEECKVHNISSFQALSGLLWTSITRARNLQPNLKVSFTVIVNVRPRCDPPFSEDHFGNFINGAQCHCNVGEILGNGLSWAAMLINGSIKALDDNTIREIFKKYAAAPVVGQPGTASALYEPNGVLVGGSARFDTYGLEFGLDKPMAVLSGYPNKDDGKVTAYPGREGGGSIDLEVCLKPETMKALELDQKFMSFVSLV